MKVLSLAGIRKRFGSTVALDGVDLDAEGGEVLALIGENGAGKSTLLNIIAGALRKDEGDLQFAGTGIAYIRQELSVFPHLSVAENVMMGREPAQWGFVDERAMALMTRELLAEFGRSEIDPADRAGDLPLASRQVVEICRALFADARLILMDEPTSSLERADVERLFSVVRKLRDRGVTIVYVSHFLEEVREIATRAVVLRDGRSVWSGALAEATDDDLVRHMVGRPVETTVHDASSHAQGEVVLEAEAFANADFKLRRGEILGIAGLVGSGRTEFLRALFGLDLARAVGLTLRGRRIGARSLNPAACIRNSVGYLGEDRGVEGLFPHLSVRENMTMTRLDGSNVSPLVERLRIRVADVEGPVRDLSGGNQQKVLLARLVHQGADILLLDEPTRGIDVGSKGEIHGQIRRMASEGKSVVMVSSYLPDLFVVCDRLAVMSRGRLSEARPVHEWTPESVLQAAIGAGVAA